MISEPELVGGEGGPGPRPAAEGGPADVVDGEAPGDRAPGRLRLWSWALGGALAASALWGAGLAAYQGRGPDLGGYRSADDLCGEAKLTALVTALGRRAPGPPPYAIRHEAVEQVRCTVVLGTAPTTYEVSLRYDLHKTIDPGPEFEALEIPVPGEGPSAERLPGLGEKAVLSGGDGGYASLTVLDGQAVLAMDVHVVVEQDEETGEARETDPAAAAAVSGIKDFLVEDMRALMAQLRTSPPPRPSPSPSA
ncbi:hypothetical protein ACFPM3_28610 [Streptomyces coeruleoprunus]|uniref:Uncharacterized protein n=1 Tax=Streptomyces coeruleoprunus TaxID=285563 RepID=A0ABV9XNQ8_9ACTN